MNFPAFSRDGNRLAWADGNGGVTIWDISSDEKLITLFGDGPPLISFAFNQDGRRLAGGGPEGVGYIWNTATGEMVRSFRYRGYALMELIYRSSGQLLSIDAGGWIVGWEETPGDSICASIRQNEIIRDAEISQDGRLGAFAYWDGTVRIAPGEHPCFHSSVYDLRGHAGNVTGVAFNPGTTLVASSGFDGTIRLWDLSTGQERMKLTGYKLAVTGVDFSPDGRYLASAGADGTVRVYIMSIEELMDVARSRVSRELTRDECQRFLHLETCPEE